MTTVSRRPGPLRDLPLEQFLPDPTTTTSSRPNKRPLSPGAPNIFSPTKRRILVQEGVFSPDKTMKSPLSSSARGRFAPSHFQELLSGPGSPARKLDFGTSSSGPSNVVASSSQLFAEFLPDCETTTPAHVASTSGRKLQLCPGCPVALISISDGHVEESLLSPSSLDAALLVIPPTLPSPHGHSIHYPGFEIWRDSNVGNSISSSLSHTVFGSPSLSEARMKEEEDKENLIPRKRSRKSMTPSGVSKETFSFSEPKNELERSGKPKSLLLTPRLSQTRDGSMTPTTRFTDLELTPKQSANVDQDELRRRRKMLVQEVDGYGEDEDEDEEET